MRWLTFILLAAFAICLQTTLARHLGAWGIYPDFMLILVVHYSLHAQSGDGLLASWLMGVLVDLTSVQLLGLVAGVYGLVALAIWLVRELMFKRHPLTHFSLTFLSCLIVQLALRGYFHLTYETGASLFGMGLVSLCSAVYTGLWAIAIHRLLLRFSRSLGLRRPARAAFSRPSRAGGAHVV